MVANMSPCLPTSAPSAVCPLDANGCAAQKTPIVSKTSRRALPALGLAGFLAACAPQDVGPGSGKARFTEYPQMLFDAFRETCTGPARDYRSSGPRSAECRALMPPQITAAFILEYDGTTEDLPRLVIRFQAEPDAGTFLVSNDVFVNIPQRRGGPRQVPFQDARLRRQLDTLYLDAGGVPES